MLIHQRCCFVSTAMHFERKLRLISVKVEFGTLLHKDRQIIFLRLALRVEANCQGDTKYVTLSQRALVC